MSVTPTITTAGSHDYMIDTHHHRRRAYMFHRDRWIVPALPDEILSKPHYRVMAKFERMEA